MSQISVANLVMFAQIHPEELPGAPRFSQKIYICGKCNLKEVFMEIWVLVDF